MNEATSSKKETSIDITVMLIHDKFTNMVTGIVKEIDGVIIQARTEEEVKELIPSGIRAIFRAKKKESAERSESIIDDNQVTEHTMSFDLEEAEC